MPPQQQQTEAAGVGTAAPSYQPPRSKAPPAQPLRAEAAPPSTPPAGAPPPAQPSAGSAAAAGRAQPPPAGLGPAGTGNAGFGRASSPAAGSKRARNRKRRRRSARRPRKNDRRLQFADVIRFPISGLLTLTDGGVEVIRTKTAVRCVAHLLDIRAKHAREAIVDERGIPLDEVMDFQFVDYVLPGSAVAACHKELMDQLEPVLLAYHRHRESDGEAKAKFNMRSAYPQLVLPLCSVSVSVSLRPARAPCWATPLCRLGSKLDRDIIGSNTTGTDAWAGISIGVAMLGGRGGSHRASNIPAASRHIPAALNSSGCIPAAFQQGSTAAHAPAAAVKSTQSAALP